MLPLDELLQLLRVLWKTGAQYKSLRPTADPRMGNRIRQP